MTNLNRIRVVVMGGARVGKSAVTVRYLTKRYIGEYSSSTGRTINMMLIQGSTATATVLR